MYETAASSTTSSCTAQRRIDNERLRRAWLAAKPLGTDQIRTERTQMFAQYTYTLSDVIGRNALQSRH